MWGVSWVSSDLSRSCVVLKMPRLVATICVLMPRFQACMEVLSPRKCLQRRFASFSPPSVTISAPMCPAPRVSLTMFPMTRPPIILAPKVSSSWVWICPSISPVDLVLAQYLRRPSGVAKPMSSWMRPVSPSWSPSRSIIEKSKSAYLCVHQVAVQPVCDCTSRCDWPRCWISRHFAVIPAGYVHVAPG